LVFSASLFFNLQPTYHWHDRAMMHDEADYPNPETFKPERYLKDGYPDLSVRDPTSLAFGFGRR
jgi:cytochrome P450